MHLIDQFAYNNQIRKLDPVYKAGFSLTVIILSLLFVTPWISLSLMALSIALAVFWAKLPVKFVFRLLLAEGSFLAFGVLGVAISVNTIPHANAIALGPFWLTISSTSVFLAFKLLARALSCVAAMNFLSLTTPLIDLIDMSRRLHIPDILIDLMTLIYRFIFTLMDCLDRMILAQEVRLGFNGWRRSLHSTGQIGANLFIEAFRRSQKLETSLKGRCWDGSLRVLPHEYEPLFHATLRKKDSCHVD